MAPQDWEGGREERGGVELLSPLINVRPFVRSFAPTCVRDNQRRQRGDDDVDDRRACRRLPLLRRID